MRKAGRDALLRVHEWPAAILSQCAFACLLDDREVVPANQQDIFCLSSRTIHRYAQALSIRPQESLQDSVHFIVLD